MLAVRGRQVVERLESLKRTARTFTQEELTDLRMRLESLKRTVRTFTREELVDLRISFKARLKAAEKRMKTGIDAPGKTR